MASVTSLASLAGVHCLSDRGIDRWDGTEVVPVLRQHDIVVAVINPKRARGLNKQDNR